MNMNININMKNKCTKAQELAAKGNPDDDVSTSKCHLCCHES